MPRPLPCGGIGDQEGVFGIVDAVELAQTADAENPALVRRAVAKLGHERDLAVVIREADAGQTLVGDAGAWSFIA